MYSTGLGNCGGSATARMDSMCRLYEVVENDEVFSGFEQKKRRLNMEQVKYLEMSFEMERKLDPERKMQLASELGLKPRQIAVWYQNRRARWKAKQMEKDYDILRQKYSSVLLEKQKLESEVMELRKALQANKGPDADQSKQFELVDLEDSLVIIEEGLEEFNCPKNSTSCCSDAASEFNVEEEDQKSNKSRILQDKMSKEIDEAEVEVSEAFYDYLTVLDEHQGMGIGSVYNIF